MPRDRPLTPSSSSTPDDALPRERLASERLGSPRDGRVGHRSGGRQHRKVRLSAEADRGNAAGDDGVSLSVTKALPFHTTTTLDDVINGDRTARLSGLRKVPGYGEPFSST